MSAPKGNDLFVAELLRGSLDHCVKCTICETACPVSNATPLFPGPKYAGPQSERYRIADELGQFLITLGPTVDFDAAVTHAVPLT